MIKIGIIPADAKDFIRFCKERGLSLGSDLIVNLINTPEVVLANIDVVIYTKEGAVTNKKILLNYQRESAATLYYMED